MSSSDRMREWEATLPPQLREKIESLVDQITQQMDVVSQRELIIDQLIKDFIRLCDEIGLPREQTSAFIKHKLKDIVSDDIIERHLPKDRKRKYERYPEEKSRNAELPREELLIESSSTKSTSPKMLRDDIPESEFVTITPFNKDIPPNEEILETAIDMSMAAAEKSDHELKELKKILNTKQDEIEKLILKVGELEFQVRDARDTKKEIQSADQELLKALKDENRLLQEALRKKIKTETFVPATEIEEPKTVWIAALNCFGLSRSLMQLSMKLTDDSSKGKILFDIAADGSIKNPRLETSQVSEN